MTDQLANAAYRVLHEIVMPLAVIWFMLPGLGAVRSWMEAKRDVWANLAKIAKRERRL